jgi:hypothetical protein
MKIADRLAWLSRRQHPPKALRHYVARIEELLAGRERIIVGPWVAEIGWEVMYWIPLLRWTVRRWPELERRAVVVSRGGVHDWYQGLASDYVDVYEKYDEATFIARLQEDRAGRLALGQNTEKQLAVTDWEQEIADWASERFGSQRLPMLHPSALFADAGTRKQLTADTSGYALWQRPDRGVLEDVLPERYIAIRFYHSRLMRNAEFAAAATQYLAERMPVVLLNPGVKPDPKHPDFETGADVVRLGSHLTLENNLGVQSIAMAHADAVVGTFGGLSFVPPHYGVPSVCFWSTNKPIDPSSGRGAWRDRNTAAELYNRPGWGGFFSAEADMDALAGFCDRILSEPRNRV